MIINGKQVKNIFHNGKQVQKVIRNGVTLYSGQHPNMVGRWSARGKTNSDADRDILKDLSGNGRDILLKNFAFTINSGYENPLYPGGLVFDGVDDYGICDNITVGFYYTIICKRHIFDTNTSGSVLSKRIQADLGEFIFEKGGNSTWSYGVINYPVINKSVKTTIQTNTLYEKSKISSGSSKPTNKLLLGCGMLNNLNNPLEFLSGVIYDLILYDRTLTEQEIQSERLKYNL